MKIKTVSLILCLILMIGCLSVGMFASAETVLYSGSCGSGVNWKITSDRVLTIYGTGSMSDFDGDSRPTYEEHLADFDHLVIENGIRRIGAYSFYKPYGPTTRTNGMVYNNMLGDLVIPDSVIEIKTAAFEKSSFDGTLTLSNNLEKMGASVFKGCQNFVGDLILPDSLLSTGEGIFADCSGFDGILELSDSQQEIRASSFSQCNHLTGSLVIPDCVTMLDTSAFAGLKEMKGTLTIGSNVQKIMNTTFSTCGFTGSLVIPDSVVMIGNRAFINCKGFDSLTIGNNVQKIKMGAFWNCSGLTGKLSIPSSVSTIEDCAFHGCASDTDIIAFFEDYPSYITIEELERVEPTESNDGLIQYQISCSCEWHKNKYCTDSKIITTVEQVIPYVYVNTLTVQNTPKSIKKGTPQQLTFEMTPAIATVQELQYSSSAENVATVDKNGYVTGLREGHVVITASTVDGSGISSSVEMAIEDPDNLYRGQCGDNVYWYVNPEGELHIYGTGDMWNFSATYRPSYEQNVDSFSHLVVEEGVTSIGNYAFYREASAGDKPVQELQYLNLTGYLVLPESVHTVGTDAFKNCKNLESEYVVVDELPDEQPEDKKTDQTNEISDLIRRFVEIVMKIVAMIRSLIENK